MWIRLPYLRVSQQDGAIPDIVHRSSGQCEKFTADAFSLVFSAALYNTDSRHYLKFSSLKFVQKMTDSVSKDGSFRFLRAHKFLSD